ncbi:hypothetical protein ACPPTL_07490 [Ralstonia pseudosolanacearum]
MTQPARRRREEEEEEEEEEERPTMPTSPRGTPTDSELGRPRANAVEKPQHAHV